MIINILLLFILQTKIMPPYVIEVETKRITLSKRPRIGEKVTVIYEVVPKNSKKNLKVIFRGFNGVKPISKDTLFHFDAKQGVRRTFRIVVGYFSTPATFKVIIFNEHSRPNGLSCIRHLINAKTGEYGSMKDVQFKRPIEYRFNPESRKFEQEIFGFEKGRWHKNRAIIDSIQNLAPALTDSLALLLYSDIPKITYPRGMTKWFEKAQYLLEQGWQEYVSYERKEFLNQLDSRNKQELLKLAKEKEQRRRMKNIKWILSWLMPVILLFLLLLVLLIIKKRRQSRVVTSVQLDKIITYFIYILVIGIALIFSLPYLGLKTKRKPKPTKKHYKILDEIEHQNLLGDLKDYELVNKKLLGTRYGYGGIFDYKDTENSRLDIEYQFSVNVYPTKQGYKVHLPGYLPEKAIKRFEGNKRVFSFLSQNKVKKVLLEFRHTPFSATIQDTIIRNGVKIPIHLKYDGNKDLITSYSVPSDFSNTDFLEIKRLKEFCERTGYRVRQDTPIRYKTKRTYYSLPVLATLVEGGRSDTLLVWFFSSDPFDFTYQWIPVPRFVKPPLSIIEQLYFEFVRAGLPTEYVLNHLKVISSCGLRKPDYFIGKGDRVILEVTIKWKTGYDWIDEINKGEGIEFKVSYEYFADSLKLGESIGKPGREKVRRWRKSSTKKFYLKPIEQIISEREVREKLFKFLPKERGFFTIYVELNFVDKPEQLNNFIYLVGRYGWYGAFRSRPLTIKVNLETGEVLRNLHLRSITPRKF